MNTEGQLIGHGEDIVHLLLKRQLHIEDRKIKEFPVDGLYRQMPLVNVLHQDYIIDLSEEHQKGSIDVFLVFHGIKYAVRIQNGGTTKNKKGGHYGDHKSKHDSVQKMMMEKSGIIVVDVWQHECKNIFKDRDNDASLQELKDAFYQHLEIFP